MAAAKVALPIAPVRTGGKWAYDFTFFTDRSMTQEEDWTGREAILSLVPRAAANLADGVFQLTSGGDGGLVILSNGVGIRVLGTATASLQPDTYDFELAWLDDGDPIPVLVGVVSIEQGLLEIADGEDLLAPVTTSGAAGAVLKAYVPGGVVQVVQGAGIRGETGPSGLILSETEPTVAEGEQVLWLKPVGDKYDILIVTGD